MGKRLKTGDKPNEYVPVEEDTQLYTELENKIMAYIRKTKDVHISPKLTEILTFAERASAPKMIPPSYLTAMMVVYID
jgi:hypothetical protein